MIIVTRITPLLVMFEMAAILAAIADDASHLAEPDRHTLADIADHVRQASELALRSDRVASALRQDYPGPRHRRPAADCGHLVEPRPETSHVAAQRRNRGSRASTSVPAILGYLADHPGATVGEIAAGAGVNVSYVGQLIRTHPDLAGVEARRDGKRLRYRLPNKK